MMPVWMILENKSFLALFKQKIGVTATEEVHLDHSKTKTFTAMSISRI